MQRRPTAGPARSAGLQTGIARAAGETPGLHFAAWRPRKKGMARRQLRAYAASPSSLRVPATGRHGVGSFAAFGRDAGVNTGAPGPRAFSEPAGWAGGHAHGRFSPWGPPTGTRPTTRGGTAPRYRPLTTPLAVRWNAHAVRSSRLYADLAHLWPLMSPPEDYADEGARLRSELRTRLGPGRARLLELGTGGGHLLHHLAGEFEATAVDLSDAMLGHARRLNPGVTHHVGDMRTVRLGETFDAVLIHDAIDYMRTEDDLRAAFSDSAWAHLRPGGAVPRHSRTTTWRRLHRRRTSPTRPAAEGRRRTHLRRVLDGSRTRETRRSRRSMSSSFGRTARLRVEVDRHTTGLFPIGTWERLLVESGFTAGAPRLSLQRAWGVATYLWVCTATNHPAAARPSKP